LQKAGDAPERGAIQREKEQVGEAQRPGVNTEKFYKKIGKERVEDMVVCIEEGFSGHPLSVIYVVKKRSGLIVYGGHIDCTQQEINPHGSAEKCKPCGWPFFHEG
jgi:hypothetical protein